MSKKKNHGQSTEHLKILLFLSPSEDLFILWGQITGDLSAVKKALVDVSSSLQDCPPFDKAPTHMTRPLEDSPYGACPESQAHPIHVSSSLPLPLPQNSGTSASHGDTSPLSLPRYAERVVCDKDKKDSPQQEVVFRMLCSDHAAGWVIGKRGAIVKALQNEAGASIMFAAPTNESGDRVVTISAWEVRLLTIIRGS